MKSESANFLAIADRDLADARGNLGINIPHQAARLAYYAQFHAAQALIFERTRRISKSHKGVNKEFHRLVKTDPTFPPRFAAQLTKAYDYNVDQRHVLTPHRRPGATPLLKPSVAPLRSATPASCSGKTHAMEGSRLHADPGSKFRAD